MYYQLNVLMHMHDMHHTSTHTTQHDVLFLLTLGGIWLETGVWLAEAAKDLMLGVSQKGLHDFSDDITICDDRSCSICNPCSPGPVAAAGVEPSGICPNL
jgi:hypothetical protein